MKISRGMIRAIIILLLLSCSAVVYAANYQVTVTNLTRNQVFAPILVVSHKSSVQLFNAGDTASTELAEIAENGNVAPMETLLSTTPGVFDFANSGGVLPPGMSASIIVKSYRHLRISMAAMLVNSNDAFVGLDSQSIWHSVTAYAPAYDAGSEDNDELCSNIPGPACAEDSGNGNTPGEGFIHIHNGIHGIGDIDAVEYDWRNPVAKVVIKRVW